VIRRKQVHIPSLPNLTKSLFQTASSELIPVSQRIDTEIDPHCQLTIFVPVDQAFADSSATELIQISCSQMSHDPLLFLSFTTLSNHGNAHDFGCHTMSVWRKRKERNRSNHIAPKNKVFLMSESNLYPTPKDPQMLDQQNKNCYWIPIHVSISASMRSELKNEEQCSELLGLVKWRHTKMALIMMLEKIIINNIFLIIIIKKKKKYSW
jgi:hypothetical protein